MSEVACPFPGCNNKYKKKNGWFYKHLESKHPGFQYQEYSGLDDTVILDNNNDRNS